ncbi:amidohydrolase family protein [Haladaptatus pallidirubidus]|uniref:amidohydrolase family protein n=1 Tax=Haladaptatus pallidirubidus TaxID=1008152 RepID=UPI0035EE2004
MSFHRPALAADLDTVGIDQFVFGTDFPFDEEDTQVIVSDVEATVESEADLERLMYSNAAELFDI